MENTKAKNVIIIVLILLLLACLGFVVYQYVSTNSSNNNEIYKESQEDTKEKETEKIVEEVKVITRNDLELIDLKNVQVSDDEKDLNWVGELLQKEMQLYDGKLTFSVSLDGKVTAYYNPVGYEGEDARLAENKEYKIENLTKKVVDIQTFYIGNGMEDHICIAIMEDGTVEEFVVTEKGTIKTNGTIKGATNVIRVISLCGRELCKDGDECNVDGIHVAGPGVEKVFAVQADGKIVPIWSY